MIGYLIGLFGAGYLVDTDEDDLFPWYVNAALTFVFIIGGITLALSVLTKSGYIDAVTRLIGTYFGFIADIVKAVAEPVIKIFL